jgi:formylglycine-generating enzyme required for sulfatase activity
LIFADSEKFMKKYAAIYLLILVTFIFSCDEKDIPTTPEGEIKIESITPSSPVILDTLVIRGQFFGEAADGKVVLPGNSTIRGSECLLWQYTIIKLEIPREINSGEIFVVAGQDTSDTLNINIARVPEIATVEVPAGSFQMGSISSSDEMPVHEVNITRSFLISQYEIDQRTYISIMNENPSSIIDRRLPVDSLKWLDAVKFCNALSNIQGLDSCYKITGEEVTWVDTANGWRLPTEAEWEYACRAGTDTDYAGTGVLDEMGWFNENSGFILHPSGFKTANDFGIYDMHGNLWEWCWDWYSRNYYSNTPSDDPKGPATGSRKVLRGGSFTEGRTFARSSNRELPSSVLVETGLRIVRYND